MYGKLFFANYYGVAYKMHTIVYAIANRGRWMTKARIHMRFQQWVLTAAFLLSVLLLGVFLVVVLGKGAEIAEQTAVAQFGQISRQAARELEEQVRSSGLFVTTHARASTQQFRITAGAAPDQQPLMPVLLSALEIDPTVYSHYFATVNGDFVQAIGVRGDEAVIRSLKAPPETYFALRVISREQGDARVEKWQFLSRSHEVLDSRSQAAVYDPTSRPWFNSAKAGKELIMTAPYVFASNQELGLTLAHPWPNGLGVMGSDISLRSLAKLLGELPVTQEGAVMVMDNKKRILAFFGNGPRYEGLSIAPLSALANEGSPYLAPLPDLIGADGQDAGTLRSRLTSVAGDKMVYTDFTFEPVPGQSYRVVAFAPISQFNGPMRKARDELIWVMGLALLVLVPAFVFLAQRVSGQLARLAQQAERIRGFDFSGKPLNEDSQVTELNALAQAQAVMQHSIHQRTAELELAQSKLSSLIDIGVSLSRESDRDALLRHILFGGRDIAHCKAATLFIRTPHNTLKFAQRTNDDVLPSFELPLFDAANGKPNDHFVATHVALHNESVNIDDIYSETRFDVSGTKRFSEESGLRTISMLTVPLSPREGEVLGVLQLINAMDMDTGEVTPFSPELVGFVEALAAQAAVALDNQSLLLSQKELMDALIKLMAGAIDAKSAYTGGHCARVPELATMLAKEACAVTEGPLADFAFTTPDEWREFHIGAWLHDCGKVTTPEYVVDKATKLETIFNRIHEVRTRFEVVLRDAEIERLKSVLAGTDPQEAQSVFESRRKQLQDDYAFVAECNLGGEFMSPERMERIRQIGQTPWTRHFDDRIGLSHEELQRYKNSPVVDTPAQEQLLADKPHQVVPRPPEAAIDPKYGFKLTVPRNLYNFGELYNLCISRGTLTEEERFKINDHVMQTIVMLEQLPLPKRMQRVPEYAGTHHEALNGTGYPRRLTAKELSIPSRIMAIADVFEALTASDRPYKKAKTLSEAIKILSFFKKDQHIDAELFELFLTSGVYMDYAQRYLLPEQIDEVDISAYLTASVKPA